MAPTFSNSTLKDTDLYCPFSQMLQAASLEAELVLTYPVQWFVGANLSRAMFRFSETRLAVPRFEFSRLLLSAPIW